METSTRKIVHDFNNFLHVIIGNIETTIKIVPERTQVRNNLEEVLLASRRAQDLAQEILSSACRDNHEPKPLQLPLVVRDTLRLLRNSLPAFIELNENICRENGWVLADPAHIQRVVMNLCTNGYHAMEPAGGRLNVSVTEMSIATAESVNLNINPGSYVRLSVSDTGRGIEREAIGKIFDPYYTTKKDRKGHGLGLCIVREIVRNHGGDIRVYSEPGKGTVFDVYLPRIVHDAHALETM